MFELIDFTLFFLSVGGLFSLCEPLVSLYQLWNSLHSSVSRNDPWSIYQIQNTTILLKPKTVTERLLSRDWLRGLLTQSSVACWTRRLQGWRTMQSCWQRPEASWKLWGTFFIHENERKCHEVHIYNHLVKLGRFPGVQLIFLKQDSVVWCCG